MTKTENIKYLQLLNVRHLCPLNQDKSTEIKKNPNMEQNKKGKL